MPVPVYLQTIDGVALHIEELGPHTHLITEDRSRVNTQFKSVTHSTATTTAIATPPSGEAIVLTDLLISSERRGGGGTATVQFEDGTNTVIIFVADLVDAPVNMGIPFAGRWRGWKDARFELVTSQATDTTVAIGYYFISGAGVFSFADWDALR